VTVVPQFALRETRGVLPPIAPPSVIAPPVPPFKVSANAPLIVVVFPKNGMLEPMAVGPPPFVVSIVTALYSVTGPDIVTVPFVAVVVVILL